MQPRDVKISDIPITTDPEGLFVVGSRTNTVGNKVTNTIDIGTIAYPVNDYRYNLEIVSDESGLIKVRLAGISAGEQLDVYTVRLMRLTKNATSHGTDLAKKRQDRFRETNPLHGSRAGNTATKEGFSYRPLMLNAQGSPASDYPFYVVDQSGSLQVLIPSVFNITNNVESNLVLEAHSYIMDWSMLPSWLVSAWQEASPSSTTWNLRVRSGKRFRADYTSPTKSYFTIRDLGFALFKNGIKVSETRRFDLICNIHVGQTIDNEEFIRGESHCYPRLY